MINYEITFSQKKKEKRKRNRSSSMAKKARESAGRFIF